MGLFSSIQEALHEATPHEIPPRHLLDIHRQTRIHDLCQELGCQTSILATMAATRTLPFNLSKPLSDTVPHSAASDAIALAPLCVNLFEAEGNAEKMQTTLAKALQAGAFSNTAAPYLAFAELSAGLVSAVNASRKESLTKTYQRIGQELFPTHKECAGFLFRAHILAGAYLGLSPLPLQTLTDICETLYSPNGTDPELKIRALQLAKALYTHHPELEIVLLLLIDFQCWDDFKQLIQPPIHEETFHAIERLCPPAASWVTRSKLVTHEPFSLSASFGQYEANVLSAQNLPQAPLSAATISEIEMALLRYQPVRQDLLTWYQLVSDRTEARLQTTKIRSVAYRVAKALQTVALDFRAATEALLADTADTNATTLEFSA